VSIPVERTFVVFVCTNSQARQHLERHHRAYCCARCAQPFSCQADLFSHVQVSQDMLCMVNFGQSRQHDSPVLDDSWITEATLPSSRMLASREGKQPNRSGCTISYSLKIRCLHHVWHPSYAKQESSRTYQCVCRYIDDNVMTTRSLSVKDKLTCSSGDQHCQHIQGCIENMHSQISSIKAPTVQDDDAETGDDSDSETLTVGNETEVEINYPFPTQTSHAPFLDIISALEGVDPRTWDRERARELPLGVLIHGITSAVTEWLS
jgi:hypothetical protein